MNWGRKQVVGDVMAIGFAGSERGCRVLGMGRQHHLSLLNGGGTVVEQIPDDSRFLWWQLHIDVVNRCQKCQRFMTFMRKVGHVSLNFFQNCGRSPKKSWANAHAWEYHPSLTEQNHRPMLQKVVPESSCEALYLRFIVNLTSEGKSTYLYWDILRVQQ